MNANLAPVAGKSHVFGATDQPLLRATIPQVLRETTARFGEREAVILSDSGRVLNYAELSAETDRLAAGFLALGLHKGDRIGIWSPNRLEWLLSQFASARIGLILVNINPAYRLSELEYALQKTGCKALILAEKFKTSDYSEMLCALAPELQNDAPGRLCAKRLPELKIAIVMAENPGSGMFLFDEILDLGSAADFARLDEIEAGLHPDEPINIQFTSGTTGAPKGATLSHFNIVNNARFTIERIGFSELDKLCIPVPLYHCFGMVLGSLGCVIKGAAMVFPGEAFDADQTLNAVASARCTGLYGVPTMFVAMLENLRKTPRDISCLRTGIMAGAPCPIEVMREVIARMNMSEVTIAYGMTETSPVSFQSFTDDPIEKRVTTVGRVHPHLEVKIVDKAGEMVGIGEKGQLCTRGYSVMQGYWGDAAQTQEVIDGEGWMMTGDLAVLDEDGFCTIVGRVKDMIIRGGENIYPREIEEFLYQHPQISEAQVFGVPDARLGEVVCAWIVPVAGKNPDAEMIQNFCKGQIAHYKIPVHFRFVEELPTTVTGKPQKFVMREWMIKNAKKPKGS